jgi:hypothetical protein
MKKLITHTLCLLTIGVFVLQLSCKKEEDNFNFNPVSLTLTDTLGFVKVKWSKVESTDFQEYILVRSIRDSINSLTDVSATSGISIVSRSTNFKTVEFIDQQLNQVTTRIYYRLFVRMKNRTFSSVNAIYNSDLSFLNAPPPSIIFENPNNPNHIYFGSSNTSQILLYDFNRDTILARSPASISSSALTVVNNNGTTELVQLFGNSLVFRDALTFDIKNNIVSTRSIQSLGAGGNGFICYYDDEWNFNYKLMRLSDRTVTSTQSQNIENTSFYGGTLFKEYNSNSFLIFYSNNVARISYDAQGNFNPARVIIRNTNFSWSSSIRISPKGNYFLVGSQLYSQPLEQLKQVNLLVGSFTDLIYSADESKMYILRSTNFSSTGIVEEYSLPSGRLLRSFGAKVMGRMAINKDMLYIFSGSNSSSTQTVVQKIKL